MRRYHRKAAQILANRCKALLTTHLNAINQQIILLSPLDYVWCADKNDAKVI